ncbi:MAG: NAD-dependent epimerase/dehydratase family protein [Chloroflexota bacterium]
MRYFMTGATGFIGGRLARQLIESGHEVVTVARTYSSVRPLLELGVEARQGDITAKETMRAAMKGADGVFHLAGWYKIGARDTRPAYGVNVEGTRNVLELMRELAIPKGVYTSTLAVFSDTHGAIPDESYRFDGVHLTEYDRTKWLAQYSVAEPMMKAGLPLVTVQPGAVYGPGDSSLIHATWVQYLKGRLVAIPRHTALTWGHVDDIAAGHLRAMERGRPGETYIIAGEVKTVAEVLRYAQEVTGFPAPRLQINPRWMRIVAAGIKPISKFMSLPEMYSYEGLRSTAGVTYLGSNARARRELGFQPRSIQEGLPETLAWEMERLEVQPRTVH